MKDENDKSAIRNGASPQVFVPGAGLPDTRRGGVAVPEKAPARTTAPAGTPIRKTPGGLVGNNGRVVSDRPPGAQNTASPPRTVGGHTARLKMPELDEPDDVPPAQASPKAVKPPVMPPRRAPMPADASTQVKVTERRGGVDTVKLDGLDPPPPLRPAPPRLPRPAPPPARAYGLDEPGGAFIPLLHEHEEPPEPRQTPTVRAVPSALASKSADDEERARERSAREASLVRVQLEALQRDEDQLRAEQRRAEQRHEEQLEAEKHSEARMREERRKEARLREEQLREQARDAVPKPKLEPPAPTGDALSPPLYGTTADPPANEAPESRWTFAIAVGCVSLALGALLPLPFRKHLAPERRAAAAGSASASPPASAAAPASASERPAQPVDPGIARPPTTGVARPTATPSSAEIDHPTGTLHVVPPTATARPTATGKPTFAPRKPNGPPGDIF